jgi:hypothetical protein
VTAPPLRGGYGFSYLGKGLLVLKSHSALSAWTHSKGSPWDVVVNDMQAPNSIIPDGIIAEYFKKNVIVI